MELIHLDLACLDFQPFAQCVCVSWGSNKHKDVPSSCRHQNLLSFSLHRLNVSSAESNRTRFPLDVDGKGATWNVKLGHADPVI